MSDAAIDAMLEKFYRGIYKPYVVMYSEKHYMVGSIASQSTSHKLTFMYYTDQNVPMKFELADDEPLDSVETHNRLIQIAEDAVGMSIEKLTHGNFDYL